jgi:hypothetical protein
MHSTNLNSQDSGIDLSFLSADSFADIDIYDVSFESNDSTLVADGKSTQKEFNHLVTVYQDLEPPFIDIHKTSAKLEDELKKAREWMDEHPYFDSSFAEHNMKILSNNNALGGNRLRVSASRKFTFWTMSLYPKKSENCIRFQQLASLNARYNPKSNPKNNPTNNKLVSLPPFLPHHVSQG